jgi:hypothetical protein
MTTAQSANDLTRQQLDELDALLQKMLALPLNAPDSPASAASAPAGSRTLVSEMPLPDILSSRANTSSTYTPPSPRQNGRETATQEVWRGDSPSSSAAIPQLLAIHTPSAPAVPVTRKAPNAHQSPVERGLPSTPPLEELEIPTDLVSNPFHVGKPAKPIADSPPVPEIPSQPVPAAVEHVPPMLVPLVVFNQICHVALGKLGVPGRMLRSGFGKNFLAIAGLGLLAVTAVKIAQLLGWITPSTSLPWPT